MSASSSHILLYFYSGYSVFRRQTVTSLFSFWLLSFNIDESVVIRIVKELSQVQTLLVTWALVSIMMVFFAQAFTCAEGLWLVAGFVVDFCVRSRTALLSYQLLFV